MDQFLRDFEVEIYQAEYLDRLVDLKNFDVYKNFKIIHNNIRSMEKNFDELKLLLRTYPGEFHVIVLTETFTIPDLNL